MTITPEQMARLPKGVQRHILSLENDIRDCRRLLSDAAYEPRWEGDTPRVFLVDHVANERQVKPIGGNFCTVRFNGDNGVVIEVSTSLYGSETVVRASASGIAVMPEASNLVRLTGRDW